MIEEPVVRQRMEHLAMRASRGFAWAAMSFVLFVGALFAILPILAAVHMLTELPHLTQMATWSLVWGGLSLVGVLAAGRLAFGYWLRIPFDALAVAAVGIALSAVVHVVLQQWQIARFGLVSPEAVGWTAGLFAVLIGLAVAAFGAMIAPRAVMAWPLLPMLMGALGVVVIVLLNVPGLGDGIAEGSWPLAIWVGLSGLYPLLATALVLRKAIGQP